MSLRSNTHAIWWAPVVCLFLGGLAVAQEQGDGAEAAQMLSAVKLLRNKCAGYSFSVARETVREAVLSRLRESTDPPPKAMPDASDLQQNLVVDFESQWNDLIKQAMGGLDADGRLGLEDKLRAHLQKHPGIKNETKGKYLKVLDQDLPAVLKQVEESLLDEQSQSLIETLPKVISEEIPSEQQIYLAIETTPAATTDQMTSAVLKRITPDSRAVLLIGSVQKLESEEVKIIEDGVAQLKEQLDILQETPKSASKLGMEKEFATQLQSLAARQQDDRQDNPMRRSYGVFDRVAQEVSVRSAVRFDQRVAAKINDVLSEFPAGQVSPADEDVLRQMILTEPQKHHDPNDSLRAAQTEFGKLIADKRTLIENQMLQELRNSNSTVDQEMSDDAFRKDIAQVLQTESSSAQLAWRGFETQVLKRYEIVLKTIVRPAIASDQARRYAPALTGRQWRPTENEATDTADELGNDDLRRLGFWQPSEQPQKDTDVLFETWDEWRKLAGSALAVCRQAMAEQSRIVGHLEPEMKGRMLREEERTRVDWLQEYCEVVLSEWSKGNGNTVTNYPKLFKATIKQIEGVVARLLQVTELARQEEQEMAKKEAQRESRAQETAPAKPEGQTPAQEKTGEDVKRGPGAGPGPGGPGTGQAEPNPHDATGTGDDRGASPEEEVEGQGEKAKEEGDKQVGPVPEDEHVKLGNGGVMVVSTDLSRMFANLQPETQADRFYQIAFWVLVVLVFLMAGAWFLHVRSLKKTLLLLQQSPR